MAIIYLDGPTTAHSDASVMHGSGMVGGKLQAVEIMLLPSILSVNLIFKNNSLDNSPERTQ